MENYLSLIRTQGWRTSGARYNAARRLRRRELISTVSLAFFSALTIALAFIQRIYVVHPGTALDNSLTALSACLGAFLLAISLMEWGTATGAKASILHRNAEDLNGFQRKIALVLSQIGAGVPLSWDAVDDFRKEYEAIKERCSVNHEPIDDLLFLAMHRRSPEFLRSDKKPVFNAGAAWLIGFRHWMSSIWYFGFFWIIILAALVFILDMSR